MILGGMCGRVSLIKYLLGGGLRYVYSPTGAWEGLDVHDGTDDWESGAEETRDPVYDLALAGHSPRDERDEGGGGGPGMLSTG